MTQSVLQLAERAINEGGYPLLSLLILLENLFPPIPSEAILPLAGYGVFRGTLTFVPALLASTLGSVVGALILYALGRYGGRPIVLRLGPVLRVDRQQLDRADHWFDRHGAKIVFFGRFLPGLRSVVSIPAGMSEMPLRSFVLLTTAGSALWNAGLIGAGWALGDGWRVAAEWVDSVDVYLLAAIGLAIVAFVVVRVRRGRAPKTEAAG